MDLYEEWDVMLAANMAYDVVLNADIDIAPCDLKPEVYAFGFTHQNDGVDSKRSTRCLKAIMNTGIMGGKSGMCWWPPITVETTKDRTKIWANIAFFNSDNQE